MEKLKHDNKIMRYQRDHYILLSINSPQIIKSLKRDINELIFFGGILMKYVPYFLFLNYYLMYHTVKFSERF